MSKANIGWLFYKRMYERGDDNMHIEETMKKVLKAKSTDELMLSKHSFKMQTSYPGLIIGSGYAHGLSSDFDAKIGFYFDHTTGLPIIQGSSVKGVLRSCFGLPVKGQHDKYEEQKHELIRELLGKEIDVKALAKEIFEGIDLTSDKQKMKSIYQRDIFYEARVIACGEHLLRDDYITPHGDALRNPTPIRFIKVAPEVEFEFNFDLKDSSLGVTAKEKKELFVKLLEMFGVGAKTNVGYGQLELVLTEEEKAQREKEEKERIENEKALAEQRKKEEAQQKKREEEEKQKALQDEKAQKAEEGLSKLLECKSLAEGFKLLKDSLGKKPKPTAEQKEIIEKYYKMQKKLSKGDEKTFKKYGI